MPMGSANTGGASSGAVRAGGAFVELFAKDAMLRKVLDGAANRLKAFGSFVAQIGTLSLIPDVAKIAAIMAPFAIATTRAAEMKLLADQVGATTEQLSELAYAFGTVGVKSEEFGNIIKGMQMKLFAAAKGGEDAFRLIGLSAKQLQGLPLDEQFKLIGAQLLKLPEGAIRTGAAMEVLGEQGAKMLRLLAKGPEAFTAALREAGEVGATVTTEQGEQATRIKEAWESTLSTIKYAILEIGSALLPGAESAERFGEIVRSIATETRKWISENKALIISILSGAAALVAFDIGLILVGKLIVGVGVLTSLFSAFIGVVGTGLAFILSPLGLVIAGVATLGTLFVTQTQTGRKAAQDTADAFSETAERMRDGFNETADTAKRAFGSIVELIRKGDMEGAFRIAAAAMILEWAKVADYWTRQWVGFKELFVDGWHSAILAIKIAWNGLTTGLAMALTYALDAVIWIFNQSIGRLIRGSADLLDLVGAGDTANSLRGWGRIEALGDEIRRDIWRQGQEETKQMRAEFERDQAARKAFRAMQVAGTADEVARARAEFERLIAEQQAGAGGKPGEPGYVPGGGAMVAALINATKGAFTSPDFSRSLGVADSIDRQSLIAAQATAKNTAIIADTVANLKGAFFK